VEDIRPRPAGSHLQRINVINMHLVIFSVISAVLISCALGVVISRNIVHSALFLLFALISVAGIYLVLLTEFLAIVQLLIYGGAIVIVILFALMLTRNEEYPRIQNNKLWPIAGILSVLVLITLSVSYFQSDVIRSASTTISPAGVKALGSSLFTTWAIPFELASLVLLVALIGAIVIARSDKDGN